MRPSLLLIPLFLLTGINPHYANQQIPLNYQSDILVSNFFMEPLDENIQNVFSYSITFTNTMTRYHDLYFTNSKYSRVKIFSGGSMSLNRNVKWTSRQIVIANSLIIEGVNTLTFEFIDQINSITYYLSVDLYTIATGVITCSHSVEVETPYNYVYVYNNHVSHDNEIYHIGNFEYGSDTGVYHLFNPGTIQIQLAQGAAYTPQPTKIGGYLYLEDKESDFSKLSPTYYEKYRRIAITLNAFDIANGKYSIDFSQKLYVEPITLLMSSKQSVTNSYALTSNFYLPANKYQTYQELNYFIAIDYSYRNNITLHIYSDGARFSSKYLGTCGLASYCIDYSSGHLFAGDTLESYSTHG